MIYGVGIDLVELDRLQQAATRRPRFIQRIFDPEEIAYAEGPHYWGRLAARFAAKEAIVKACRGFRGTAWRDIVIYGELNHPPLVTVRGPLGQWLESQGGRLHVSLTHERHTVAAVAVLEVPDAPAHLDH